MSIFTGIESWMSELRLSRRLREQPKLYVIRKYVMAVSVVDAARKDKSAPVHEIFIDEKWQEKSLADVMGFAPK